MNHPMRHLPPLPAWSAAVIAALIGFGGTVALIVQAMRTLGATPDQTGSAVTALCLGIAIPGAILSFRMRMPIVLAWSTPGAALLAAAAPGLHWPVAIGAFVVSGALMVALGLVPALGRLAARIPPAIASAMLAGVLLPFCLSLFRTGGTDPLLVAALVLVFLAARQRVPLYALLLVLATGAGISLIRGDVTSLPPGATLGTLLAVMPKFDPATLVSIAIPLFLVTLVSQNLPGLVVLRSAGYEPQPGPLLAGTGLMSVLIAPFGGHAVNLAAITASICTSPEALPDQNRRWIVGLLYAGCYVILAAFAPLLVRFFLALPHGTIAALTGIALIPALLGALETALSVKEQREPALMTILAAGSGLTLFGLGAAFWGLLVGFAALGVAALLRKRQPR